jgi:hypothetical protein
MKKTLTILLLTSTLLLAKDYALIIGISNYKNMSPLSHINSDIKIYKKILKSRGVKGYIPKLTDRDATKYNILTNLENIIIDMKKNKHNKNNRFFMFFAGHGMSVYSSLARKNISKNNLKNTGIILPYEYSQNNINNTVIIGKRDLRTLLKEIDRYVKDSLIIVDACFSEKSIRTSNDSFILSDSKNYPYKNIVYIASSTAETKSRSGVLSKVLNKCLSQNKNLKKLRVCMNNKLSLTGQTAVIHSR